MQGSEPFRQATGSQDVELLASALARATRILVITGAGVSTASGIPDYRGPQGVWNTRRPVFYNDFMRSAASRRAYWQQKLEDRSDFGDAEPNDVHRAIARLHGTGVIEMVVTQNVDGLHRAAGTPSEGLVEIHGSNAEVECQSCHERGDPVPHFDSFVESGEAPVCHCGGFLKPATISFGQSLRSSDIERAWKAAEHADFVLALGTTLAVEPAASIPLAAVDRGVPYVIVNRGPTEHDHLDGVRLRIEGDVGDVVPQAVERVLA